MLHSARSLVLLATFLLAACESSTEEGGDSETGGDELSHAADIQPIWDDNCLNGCHTPGGIGMPLDLTNAYAAIVGVESMQAAGVNLVEAGSSADSYLLAKLRGEQMELGGVGIQMPGGGAAPLDDATISTIAAWIDAGAPE
jgi:predicted small secreted protein